MSQSNQLSCQTTFLHLLHGKVDTATLAEFHQLQVQMDSSNDLILLDATSNVGLKKVFNEASKTGTIKDIDAICQVTYNILYDPSNGTCPFVECHVDECTASPPASFNFTCALC
jgi:N-acetylglutamate synthase/N-acetylornithine aminotransferase